MSDAAAYEPLSVGLIGLSPDGFHLIEAMTGGGPFRVVMAWDDQPNPASAAESLGVTVVTDLNSLLAAPAVEVFWLAKPCGLDEWFAELLLQANKPIVGELPLGLSVEHVQSILAKARSRGIPILPHCPRRSTDNFRHAQLVTAGGELGQLLAAKWGSWSYGLIPTSTLTTELDREDFQIEPVLFRLLAHTVDQLLQLIPARPERVVAFSDSVLSKSPGDAQSIQQLFQQSIPRAVQTVIEFRGGARAEIDVRLDSPVSFQTGWLLTGERGGFADNRRFHVATDGEVFDAPTPAIGAGVNQYAELARRLRALPHTVEESDRSVTVAELLAAILSSVQSGQVTLMAK